LFCNISACDKQVNDALFELVRDSQTNKITLGMQKYTVGYPPPGSYHRISTTPITELDLRTLREKGTWNSQCSEITDDLLRVAVACMAVKPKTYSLTTNNCQHFATSFLTNIMPSLDTTTLQRMMFSLRLTPIKIKRGRICTQAGEDALAQADRDNSC
jgi:hypothetical protein